MQRNTKNTRHITKKIRPALFHKKTNKRKSKSYHKKWRNYIHGGIQNIVSNREIISAVLNKYLNSLKPDDIETKFINDILSKKDKKKDLIDEIILDKDSYVSLWEAIGPSTKENLTKIEENPLNENIKKILDDIFNKLKKADDIVKDITDKLKEPVITKKLSKKQIEQINQIIENQPSMLTNVSKNIASGFEQFGSWLIPAVTTDMSGNPIKEHNQTKIHFLWYPRMHAKYRKGSSGVGEKIKYGDFMVYVEPEKYSSTAEYIVQSADSVDDLLTNVLNGYQQSAVPEPYKHKIYTINNYQPFFNKPENITNLPDKESDDKGTDDNKQIYKNKYTK